MIRINHIYKKYDDRIIFEDLSYEFKDNGFYFLLGKSGSGKTTLLNLIGNLEACSKGNIESSDDICYVFQEANLLTDFTVYENIKITGIEDGEIDEILDKLHILDLKHKVVNLLSGGEKQRVAIGRALAMGCQILLLDEPTGNLDEQNTIQIIEILKDLSKNKLIIMATHDKKLADLYGDIVLNVKDRTLYEKIQSLPIAHENINNNKVDVFSLKYQFLYSLKLISSRPIKYLVTVLLGMFSMLLLFFILNVIFFNENHVIQNAILTDNRQLYSITKEYYNEPTNDYLNYSYGLTLEEELSSVVENNNYCYYKKISFPNVSYDVPTEFQLIILNDDFEGVHITDFVSNYLFSTEDCLGKKIDIRINNIINQFEITGVNSTDYTNVYDLYFSDSKYMNNHKDDFLFHYGTVYISLNTYKEIILSEPLHLQGTNFTLNDLDLRTYMSSYYTMSFNKKDNLNGNQVIVSKDFYDTFMKDALLPANYDIRNIEDTINKNLYKNILNFYTILKSVTVVDIDESLDVDVSVSNEIYYKLADDYIHYMIDGICLDDNLEISKLHKFGFEVANDDIRKIYTLNQVFNNVLKIAILVVCLIIAAIAILSLFFSISGFMDKKAKEFFIMKSLGISRRKIVNIFIIYTSMVIAIGLFLALIIGQISLSLFNDYLKNEVFFVNYKLFIFQYEPYLTLIGLVVLTRGLILLNPIISLKKIDIAILVKINN